MLIHQEQPYILPLCEAELEIIYEDDALLICNKPSGLLSLPGKHPLNQDSVLKRLRHRHPQAALAHRLDLDTSGILLAAKYKSAHAHLNKQFAQRQLKKTYSAIVDGAISPDSINSVYKPHISCTLNAQGLATGDIHLAMRPNPDKKPTQMICLETGKQALTSFSVSAYNSANNTSHIQLSPHTGRSHQLRLHCLSLGHAIIGCDLYAGEDAFYKAQRLCLHASAIEFKHPETEASMYIHCPAPF